MLRWFGGIVRSGISGQFFDILISDDLATHSLREGGNGQVYSSLSSITRRCTILMYILKLNYILLVCMPLSDPNRLPDVLLPVHHDRLSNALTSAENDSVPIMSVSGHDTTHPFAFEISGLCYDIH